MSIEIKSRWSGNVIYASGKDTMHEAVLAAIKAGANLSWADLSRADLSGADLSWAGFSGADLSRADLSWADLSGADLSGANLSWADLSRAGFSGANLSGANLSGADLSWAGFSGADLSRAGFSGANLSGADLSRAKNGGVAAAMTVVAAQGELRAWKKIREGVIELRIPAEAKRSNASGRKCRAEFAVVVSLPEGVEVGHSLYDGRFEYRLGQTVRPTNADWCEDRWQECAPGIHFYITPEEAEAHQ